MESIRARFVVFSTAGLAILIVSLYSATFVASADPCAGPAGANNPKCTGGEFPPGNNPCAGPAGASNPNCVDGGLNPPGLDEDSDELDDSTLPNRVTIDAPSTAAGTYAASGANFGPAPTVAGVSGDVVLVNDGSGNPTLGCDPLVGFPAGAIALIDRGVCTFVQKVSNAEAAGAVAVIVVNHLDGSPVTMGGTAPEIDIPSVMVSLDDGNVVKAGLPASGTVSANP